MEFENDDHILDDNKDMVLEGGIYSDCPIGWGAIVRQLFKDIREVCRKHKCELPRVVQIKSKFGCLCFNLDQDYHSFDIYSEVGRKVMELIYEAEKKSMITCEITGLTGSYYVKNGWYATLNKDKAIELGYKEVK